MNTAKISDLPNGTTIDPVKDLIEVSQYTPQTGGYTSIKSPIGVAGGSIKQLGMLKGANLNTTADQLILLSGGSRFIILDVVITNASVNITNAKAGQINDGANKGGNEVFNTAHSNFASDLMQNLTTPLRVTSGSLTFSMYFASAVTNSVGSSVYFSLGTPQGVACTADVYIHGSIIS